MKYPKSECFCGSCATTSNIMYALACVPRKNTTKCGVALFISLSPFWLLWFIYTTLIGVVSDALMLVFWLICCSKLGRHTIGYQQCYGCCDKFDEPVLEDAHCFCSSLWWKQVYNNSPNCCCNDGCLSARESV